MRREQAGVYNIQQNEWICSQKSLWNSKRNGLLQNRVRSEGCPSCSPVLQALISSGKSRLWNFIPCSSERGIFCCLNEKRVYCNFGCMKKVVKRTAIVPESIAMQTRTDPSLITKTKRKQKRHAGSIDKVAEKSKMYNNINNRRGS